MIKLPKKWLSFTLVFLITFPLISQSKIIKDLVIFGDSLSDSGNTYLAAGTPGTPYFEGRFTNGLNYVDHLSQALGIAPILPSLAGGTNYAWGGAMAQGDTPYGGANIPGITTQMNQYLFSLTPDKDLSKTLHLVFIGGNDVIAALDLGLNSTQAQTFLQNSATQTANAIKTLDSLQGTHFLIPEVPDLSLSPRFFNQTTAQEFTQFYNQSLKNALQNLNTNSTIDFFNLSNFIKTIDDGFVNAGQACLSNVGICDSIQDYLFFDDIHPTSQLHQLVANQIYAQISEPSTPILYILGAFLFFGYFVIRLHLKNKFKRQRDHY